MIRDPEKTEFNIRAKISMPEFLRSKSWVEKVNSIKRMNDMSKKARAAMKQAAEDDRSTPQQRLGRSES